jgi:tripartite-type tricarboxylate transporter receptor subunit TctC
MDKGKEEAVVVALLGVRVALHVSPYSQLARHIVSGNLATVLAVDHERAAPFG